MGESIYKIKRGDLFLQSKHADVSFIGEEGWALFWFNEPKKGKCLCVEYNRSNWPAAHVTIKANWKAEREIASYRKDGALWAEQTF